MQLQQNIPTLGGLAEPPQRSHRREQLAADGERARRDIEDVLRKARRLRDGAGALRAPSPCCSAASRLRSSPER